MPRQTWPRSCSESNANKDVGWSLDAVDNVIWMVV